MNILIIHEVDWLKKITYEMHHLSELFSLKGHNVHVIDMPDFGMFSLDKKNFQTISDYNRVYEKSSVTIHRTPTIPVKGLNRMYAYFTSYKFIKKIISENDIDIVFMYLVVTNAKATIRACKEIGIPVIHRTFDIIHELIREKYLKEKVKKIEKAVYPSFDLVLANTPFMKHWALEMGAKNVIVVPQGVDPNIMKPMKKDKNLQKKLKILEQDNVVMYLGTIESFSGLDVFLKKIPNMLKTNPNLKILVVGGGGYLGEIKTIVKELGISKNVIFTGYVPYTDIPKYCSLAKVCINTFQINDMTNRLSPVKIFDMLACEKIIVTTKLQGLQHDFPQEIGILVYSDLEKFDESINSILKNEKNDQTGIKGRIFIEKNFTWGKIADIVLNKIEEVIYQSK